MSLFELCTLTYLGIGFILAVVAFWLDDYDDYSEEPEPPIVKVGIFLAITGGWLGYMLLPERGD